MRPAGRPRSDEMRTLHELGWTLQEIGDRFGITRERVRQILRSEGVPPRGTGETRRLRRRLAVEGREDAIVRRFQELGDEKAVAQDYGLPVQTVVGLLRERLPHRSAYRPKRDVDMRRYSDEEIRSCIRAAAAEVPGPLRLSDYARVARGRAFADGRAWPSPATIWTRFRWTDVLAELGIAAHPSGGRRSSYSRLDCVESIATLWRHLGHAPTVREYERWSAGKRGVPSLSIVRMRVGSWRRDVLRAAAPLVEHADAS